MANQKTSISVVITTFNNAEFLDEAIRSCVSQDIADLEIIVIDDGSSNDAAQDVVANYKETSSRVIEFRKQDNAGPSSARNHGLSICTGDMVAFLDGDDYFADKKLSVQSQLLLGLDQDYACVLGATARFNNVERDKRRYTNIVPPEFSGFLDINLFLAGDVRLEGTPGYLFRREALNRVGGFDATLTHNEDFDLILKLAQHYKIHTHNDVVFYQRLHKQSLSQADPIRILNQSLTFAASVAKRHPDISIATLGRHSQRAYFSAALACIKRFRFAEGKWLAIEGRQRYQPMRRNGKLFATLCRLIPAKAKRPGQLTEK